MTQRHPWLIVEDESIIGFMIEDALTDLGLSTLGPVGTIAGAMAMAQSRPLGGAVLDVNIGGTPVYPVAGLLLQRHVPFLFLTGYGEATRPAHLQDVPVLTKPFVVTQLHAAVRKLVSGIEPPRP